MMGILAIFLLPEVILLNMKLPTATRLFMNWMIVIAMVVVLMIVFLMVVVLTVVVLTVVVLTVIVSTVVVLTVVIIIGTVVDVPRMTMTIHMASLFVKTPLTV